METSANDWRTITMDELWDFLNKGGIIQHSINQNFQHPGGEMYTQKNQQPTYKRLTNL